MSGHDSSKHNILLLFEVGGRRQPPRHTGSVISAAVGKFPALYSIVYQSGNCMLMHLLPLLAVTHPRKNLKQVELHSIRK